ncbi:methyl-accepting chemotaxis protein [Marinobacter sp. M3C]|uniref:methyl-accepting chemotaxis protein n=1 Tax=Marinobacter sp. M3C TaxID=2917715 RepID=UPI00200FFC07|nr:HAMP domain-containing methyl-accepting chemotaxis protein [Marinobacter sp. M3C]UQG61327.1 methyl-accepting chemotaxis protein [Marinobacter sp. M3C]
MKKHYSIRFMLLLALATAFSLVLAFTVFFSAQSQREHVEEFSHKYVDGLAKSYFDALNTMMVTGTMHNREILREKTMAPEDVLNVRVVRSDHLNRIFGSGNIAEQTRGPLDEKALAGERIEHYSSNESGRVYTLIEPVIAMADYQGVNCLGCHQAQEGDVLGAIRIEYSVAETDARLQTQLLTSAGTQAVLLLGVFAITAWVLGHLVFSRLRRLRDRMDEISRNSDLTLELDVVRNDEIGLVSNAFNRMISKIRDSMNQVMVSAEHVEQAARDIASKAGASEREVVSQRDNTDQVASATTEMAASALQVQENAITTTRKSAATAEAAGLGEELAQSAVGGIETLNAEVQNGAQRIEALNQRTAKMTAMLETISNIADQTNLLALNAAIEAARAGEAGRGFSVVADEVRALASRTQVSTADIRDTINGLKEEVMGCLSTMRGASDLASQQVDAILKVQAELKTIAQATREITSLNQEMESAANEQSNVSDAINQNVIEISRSAEQTTLEAQQTAQIAAELLVMAENLRQTIGQFKLAPGQDSPG